MPIYGGLEAKKHYICTLTGIFERPRGDSNPEPTDASLDGVQSQVSRIAHKLHTTNDPECKFEVSDANIWQFRSYKTLYLAPPRGFEPRTY